MLGYGGTDKPADPALYVQSAMSQDLVCILDAEKVEKVVAVGHDWCVLAWSQRVVDVLTRFAGEQALSPGWPTGIPNASARTHSSPLPTPRLDPRTLTTARSSRASNRSTATSYSATGHSSIATTQTRLSRITYAL